jgi:hypothetical protein
MALEWRRLLSKPRGVGIGIGIGIAGIWEGGWTYRHRHRHSGHMGRRAELQSLIPNRARQEPQT